MTLSHLIVRICSVALGRKITCFVLLTGLFLVLTGCEGNSDSMQQEAAAKIEGTSENEVKGEASFSQDGDKIVLKIDIMDAAPGIHGVHIHETGDCGDDGKSAGGHWNPTDVEHGKWGEGEFHLGDLGNMAVIKDGRGYIERTTDLWEVGTGSDRDLVGKAIIVHGEQDDFETQPTGAAGPRIGCGVIELQQ